MLYYLMPSTRVGKSLFFFFYFSAHLVPLGSHFCLQYKHKWLFWTMGNTGSHTCDEATEKPYFCYDPLTPSIVVFSFHNFLLFSSEFREAFWKEKKEVSLFPSLSEVLQGGWNLRCRFTCLGQVYFYIPAKF